MKITIVCGFFLPVPPVAGGAVEKMWWRLARRYVQRGHEVTLLSRHWPGWANDEVLEGVHIRRLRGYNHRRRLWQNLGCDAWWGFKLLFDLPDADILVTNTVALPIVVRLLRPETGRLVVNMNRYPKGQLRWYHDVARVQAASSIIARAATQQAPRLAPAIRVVPNSIDTAAFAGRAPERAAGAAVTLGFFGRIHPEKGLATLVMAAKQLARDADLPPWRLLLRGPVDVARGGGGDGFVHQLRASAPELWAEGRITIAEPIFQPAALAQAYLELDVFCYPTEAVEGEAHPVAVLEAMASGLPVVATDLPCFADQLVPDENALLVPPSNPAALAAALARLIRSPATRRALADRARAAVSDLDDSRVADQHLADFASLLHV